MRAKFEFKFDVIFVTADTTYPLSVTWLVLLIMTMCVLRCTITLFQQKLKRKGDQFSAPDQENYEKEVANANFRMDILTERASQHYKNSLEKFQELDRQLMDDPRL